MNTQYVNQESNIKAPALFIFALSVVMFATPDAVAGTINTLGSGGLGGTVFKPLYDFFVDAATGYLGRSLAIVGGLIGMGMTAFGGAKPIFALIGVLLAIFGVFGPSLINAIYASALI